jgi:hypothetical protein
MSNEGEWLTITGESGKITYLKHPHHCPHSSLVHIPKRQVIGTERVLQHHNEATVGLP